MLKLLLSLMLTLGPTLIWHASALAVESSPSEQQQSAQADTRGDSAPAAASSDAATAKKQGKDEPDCE